MKHLILIHESRIHDAGWRTWFLLGWGTLLLALAVATVAAAATTFDWDNWSGNSEFHDAINWRPGGGPPGAVDSAIFDGQLENLGIGKNGVHVLPGTAITDMQVIDTAIVDLTIGDGTTDSQFRILRSLGDGLILANSAGDTATLNLLGGWLDTYRTVVGGRATINVINPGSYWDSADVLLSGDTTTNTAGVGLALGAQIITHGSLDIGSDTGSGRVVIDGTVLQPFDPRPLWTITGLVDIGPTSTTGFNFGQLTVQDGGRMSNQNDFFVHGTSESTSKATVRTGGELTVTDLLQIGSYGTLELFDAASKITSGSFSKTGSGGSFNWAAGTLEITNERVLLDSITSHAVLGSTLTVGVGKKLVVSKPDFFFNLVIGDAGTGSLTVEGGGDVESLSGAIGFDGTGHGVVTVRDSGSTWSITEELRIGNQGSSYGELYIQNGGSVSTSLAAIGAINSARGTVVVDGLNSSLTSTGILTIAEGDTSSGALTIQNQGMVTSATAWIGSLGTTTATVIVDGTNSQWSNTGDMLVGNNAGGSSTLTVRNSGTVAAGGTLTVDRSGSVALQTNGKVYASSIALAAGASFSDSAGSLVRTNRLTGFGDMARFRGSLQLGHSCCGSEGWHTVGSGQTLTIDQSLVVGLNRRADLNVETGGRLESGRTFIATSEPAGLSNISINGGRWIASDSIFVGGTDSAAGATGAARVYDGGLLRASGSVKVWPNGLLQLSAGSIINATSVELTGWLVSGEGTLALAGPLSNAGYAQLSGPLSVSGIGSSYSQTATGTLSIVIGGANPGDYGRLSVVGSAALDGVLSLMFGPVGSGGLFVPAAGNSFDVLDWGSRSGTFDLVTLPSLSPGLMWNTTQLYTSGLLRVLPIGDYNTDGVVNTADYVVWRNTYSGPNVPPTSLAADGDGDGDVDENDYAVWRSHFGQPALTGSLAGNSAAAAIPEPATWIMTMGVAISGLLAARADVTIRAYRLRPRVARSSHNQSIRGVACVP